MREATSPASGDDYRLVLPENVELRFDVAGVGSRVAAAMVDYFILYALIAAAAIAFNMNRSFLRWLVRDTPLVDFDSDWIGNAVLAGLILVAFFAWWGYFLLFELLWNGQSPGKRLLRLRVVRADGQPVSASASLVRNLLRAIDSFMAIGVAVMMIDGRSRRLGDFAAGTVVVREPGGASMALADVPIPPAAERAAALAPTAGRLTMDHYTLLRDFFARSARLPRDRARRLAEHLATDIARVLDVPAADIGDPLVFLAAAAHAFESRHRYDDL